ncbi:MAG: 30S ribosomal protein S8 [bacterium]
MSMTDPIADMLTRLRNGITRQKEAVDIPASKIKRGICRKLLDEGYLREFKFIRNKRQGLLRVYLKYDDEGRCVINSLKRKSKPSLRVYIGVEDIPVVKSGIGTALLSTPRGVLTGKEARQENVGGEYICEVW